MNVGKEGEIGVTPGRDHFGWASSARKLGGGVGERRWSNHPTLFPCNQTKQEEAAWLYIWRQDGTMLELTR